MIVFDLRCGGGHVFEAWFGSSDDFGSQKARGLLSCPICGDESVEKAVMAPNIAAKGNRRNADTGVPPGPTTTLPATLPAGTDVGKAKEMLAELARIQAKVLENSDWVGRDFAREARAIHDGESDRRSIHGEASHAEVKSLIEDGIGVAPLPLPVTPPEKQN